jgi:hypothetical protein
MTSAKIIKHSITEWGQEIITFELEYPRIIHSELLTHKILSKSSASSRAIPILTMIKAVWNNPAAPVSWGKNQAGMSAKEDLTGWRLFTAKKIWDLSSKFNCIFSFALSKIGAHKQIANRLTESSSFIKVLVTGTNFENWYKLRDHKDADPTIHQLAANMKKAHDGSTPKLLKSGEWHLPYVEDDGLEFDIDSKLKLSASLCAQTSYRKADESLEKACRIYDKLVDSEPAHFSPMEHQATPLYDQSSIFFTHKDKLGRLWSGNFCGWGQYRQKIQNEKSLEPMTCKSSI